MKKLNSIILILILVPGVMASTGIGSFKEFMNKERNILFFTTNIKTIVGVISGIIAGLTFLSLGIAVGTNPIFWYGVLAGSIFFVIFFTTWLGAFFTTWLGA